MKKISQGKKIVYRIVDGEAVLLNGSTGMYYHLNKTGTEVFLGILNGKSIEKIAELQSIKYKKSQGIMKKDVLECVKSLLEKNIITEGRKMRPSSTTPATLTKRRLKKNLLNTTA